MVFFFKQKTAYEMRISDWSSDVCSSDLLFGAWPLDRHSGNPPRLCRCPGSDRSYFSRLPVAALRERSVSRRWLCCSRLSCRYRRLTGERRSDEHKSELQSLMRISYAVFCMKKKNVINQLSHATLI